MTLFSLFKATAQTRNTKGKRVLVSYLNRQTPMPFRIYFSEDSTKDKLVFMVVHEKGTTHKVYVIPNTDKYRKIDNPWSLHLEIAGSNWHHLKGQFSEWCRTILTRPAPETLITRMG